MGSASGGTEVQQDRELSNRVERWLAVLTCLHRGDYEGALAAVASPLPGDRLDEVLCALLQTLAQRAREAERFERLLRHINSGLLLDDILNNVYTEFRDLIPYDRLGLSLLEEEGRIARSRWGRLERGTMYLRRGYAAPLAGSSLQAILETGQPRILNDLHDYLAQKPSSESTRLIVAEGMRSSLTCPLIVEGRPLGFLFFSSASPNTYRDVHVETFLRLADHLAVAVARGHLTSQLNARKRAIERQNRTLDRLNTQKNAFLGIAAHDLRGPLSLVEMSTAILLDPHFEVSADDEKTLLQDMRAQARHMMALIDDLLDVAVIEQGQLRLRLQPLDLRQVLTESVAQHQRLAQPKGVRVLLNPSPAAGIVHADPQRLRQVLDNLISNAVRHSPPGSSVQLAVERHESGWRVTVKDDGPGIPWDD